MYGQADTIVQSFASHALADASGVAARQSIMACMMLHFTRQTPAIPAFICMLLLAGCGFLGKDEKKTEQRAQDLFNTADNAMRRGRLHQATESFEALEETYPFSPYAQQVTLSLAYLYYRNYKYAEAEAELEKFISLNPRNPNLDYAYYLKGLTNYNNAKNFFSIMARRDRTAKDPTFMIKAFNAFKALLEKYPQSRYVENARSYLIMLRDILAFYELRVADFYMRRGAYVAVVNRCKYALEHYPGAQHTPQVLTLLATAYRRLGLGSLSSDTLEVLALNYPRYYQTRAGNAATEEDADSLFRSQ